MSTIDRVGDCGQSWPSAKRVRSDAWMLAISSAAPTPLPETSPTSSATCRGQREVVEEVAADLARRHRDALHLRQAEVQRRARQHVGLNLPAELELAAWMPLLLDERRAGAARRPAAIWLNAAASCPISSRVFNRHARA